MNRREFLRGLLALPLAPVAAKLLPAPVPEYIGMDLASGPDQTSIWLWGDFRAAEDDAFVARMQDELVSNFLKPNLYLQDLPWNPASVRLGKRNWLKESIHGH